MVHGGIKEDPNVHKHETTKIRQKIPHDRTKLHEACIADLYNRMDDRLKRNLVTNQALSCKRGSFVTLR